METVGALSTTTGFAYDDAGNRISTTTEGEETTFEWDVEGELVAVDDAAYVYDASGTRIVRSDEAGTTVYLPGGQELLISQEGEVSATRYYSFGGQLVAVRDSRGMGGVESLVVDHQGSVVGAVPNTDWTPGSVEIVRTNPFGGARGNSDANIPGDRRFLGLTHDESSGLSLFGARYYDAVTGTFLSVDPKLDPDNPAQFNAYVYGWNNPVTHSDPTGLEPASEKMGLGKTPKSTATGAPPGSTAALLSCSDPWCVAGWGTAVYGQYLLGLGNSAWELVVASCTPCQMGQMLADDIIPMFTDFDTYLAQQQAESQALWDFWGGPNPVGELGNSLWNSFTTDLMNNPGHLTGNIVGTASSFAIPGAGVVKAAGAVNKVDNVMDAASTAARACSFTGATVVLMADGELKPIASVAVGDLVVASDPETGEQAAKPVEQVFVHEDVVFDLVIGDEVISTTEDHPFWSVTDHRFERADELEPGELVLSADGAAIQVSEVVAGSGRAVLAYNLAVDDIHTFHVGARAVLVHNVCELDVAGLSHVADRHTLGGKAVDAAAGVFDDGVDLAQVAASSHGQIGLRNPATTNIEYLSTQPGIVGVAGNGGLPTNQVRIIRSGYDGSLVTMFPVAR